MLSHLCNHCVCSLGCCSGPGCFLPWDTEDRTDHQCSPAPRLRHTHPHRHRYWTTPLLQRSRWVLCPRVPLHANTWAALRYYTGLMHFFLFLDIISHISWPAWLRNCRPNLFIGHLRLPLCRKSLWNIPGWWFICRCCLSVDVFFSVLFCFLSHRSHGWWRWASPGLTPLRPSELQTTTSTWQPTSSCNTEGERERERKQAQWGKNKRWMRTERGSRKRSNQSRGAKRNEDGDKTLEKTTVSDGD